MINERGTNHRTQCHLFQNSDGNDGTYNKITLLIKLAMRLECRVSESRAENKRSTLEKLFKMKLQFGPCQGISMRAAWILQAVPPKNDWFYLERRARWYLWNTSCERILQTCSHVAMFLYRSNAGFKQKRAFITKHLGLLRALCF